MLNPPLFIELTNSESGETEAIQMSRIHTLYEFADPQNLRTGTVIRTYLDMGILTPQGIQIGYVDLKVREKKATIYNKIKKLMQSYHKVAMRATNEFDDGMDDYQLYS